MKDLFDRLLILRSPGIGPAGFFDLVTKFGNPARAAESLVLDCEFKDSVYKEIETAQRLGIKYLSDDDPLYPVRLKSIKNHPPVLTVRGNPAVFAKKSVAIVGTRHATGAGLRLASEIAEAFARNNHAVVSGMAMGTDSAAHIGALRAPDKAATIAVLAGGADYVWPLENESLYREIIERGAIVSEMPVGFRPERRNFTMRNRWIAGLADMLILGEADPKSGSMSTARFAIEYDRPVHAIPSHPSDPRAAGPNGLIKEGRAFICTGVKDFFDDTEKTSQMFPQNKKIDSENALIDKMGIIPLSESVLAQLVGKNVMEIKRDLVVLELQGMVAKVDGGYVKI